MENRWLIILLTIYVPIIIFLSLKNVAIYANIVNPIFWGIVIIYLIYDIKSGYIRFLKNREAVKYLLVVFFCHTIVYLYMLYTFELAKSPYSHKLLSLLKNIAIQVIPVVAIELVRIVLVIRNKNNKILVSFITILIFLLEIKYNTLIDLIPNKEEFFKFVCKNILPAFSYGILYTYLVLKVSPSISLILRTLYKLFLLTSPFFPNTDWFATGATSVILASVIYFVFKYKLVIDKQNIKRVKKCFLEKFYFNLALIFCIFLVLFMLGTFKYEPIAILSNSMSPKFNRGDIIIFEKMKELDLKKLAKGMIIVYELDGQNIAHRINAVEENSNISYQTKGDNNDFPDMKLVKINQIKGVYVFHLKYLGFPSIWLYDFFNSDTAKVEIK